MPTRDTLGGIVHTYQRYDPARIPSPRPADVDLVSPAMAAAAGIAGHFVDVRDWR